MPQAIIVAHGQPSDPHPAEAALAAYAARVNALCDRVTVGSATLAAPGKFEAALDRLQENSVIYPLFMAKGWFTTSALPKRIGARPVRVLDPLGTDPKLPELVAQSVQSQIADLGWTPGETDLVLAAHGSGRSRNPSKVATEFLSQLCAQLPFQNARVGFVEEDPGIDQAARGMGRTSLCLPFFACTGGHVLMDVPEALERADFAGHVMPVIGELPEIQARIAAQIDRAFDA